MTNIKKHSDEYVMFLNQARQIITTSQEQFLRTANRISMEVRLGLGKIIDDNSIKYDWGKSILEKFSKDLTRLFPGSTGFSVRNLAYMRQFYSEYIAYPELMWSSNLIHTS